MEHPLSNPEDLPEITSPAATGTPTSPTRSGTEPSTLNKTTSNPQQQLHARGPVASLDREAIKQWVLKTFTAEAGLPVLSSVVAEVSSLSEDERARLRLDRLQVMNTSTMTTSNGVVTAPVQGAAASATSPNSKDQQQQATASPSIHQDPNSGEKGISVSQNEIVHMLETMDSELKRHWEAGDCVKALRLAIQSTKMLSHASRVPECFPSMFVLVATVLDSLGDRVADLLAERAIKFDPIIERHLAEGRADFPHVPPEASELCGNWFHKILSIRELLCRVTVELALLKCFKYAGEKSRVPVKQVIVRLGQQIRGVANPQVASHLRWYLFLRARDELATRGSSKKSESWAQSLAQCAFDNLEMMTRMEIPGTSPESPEAQRFVGTFQPSLRWMFDTIIRFGGSASATFVDETLRIIAESDQLQYGSVAAVFLQCAPVDYLFKNFDRIWEFLETDIKHYSRDHSKLRCLGELLAALASPNSGVGKMSKSKRAQMLNLLFGAIVENQQLGNLEDHFFALVAAINFTSRYLPFSAVVTVLDQVRNLVNYLEDKRNEALLKTLGGVGFIEQQVSTVIRWVVESVSPDSYIPCATFVNLLLTTASLSPEKRRSLVEHVLQHAAENITIPSVAQSAFELCRVLHDGLSATAAPEEIEATEKIVTQIVAKTFTPNAVPENLLRFYAECRHVLSRFSDLRKTILYEALRLVVAVPSNQIQKKRQQLRPCLAFVHATCPAVTSPLDRARVAADAACVAYERGFVAQGEALMETALMSLDEVQAVFSTAATSVSAGSVHYNDKPACQVATQLIHVGIVMPPPISVTSGSSSSNNETNSSSDNSKMMMYAVDSILKWASSDFGWNDKSQAARLAAATISLLSRAKKGLLQESTSANVDTSNRGHQIKGGKLSAASENAASSKNDNSSSSISSKLYHFSSLQRVALHKIPEYVSACSSLQLKALRLLEQSMPCDESGDAIEVAEVLLGAFVANGRSTLLASSSSNNKKMSIDQRLFDDYYIRTGLSIAMKPLLGGRYAQAEQHYEEFQKAKTSLVTGLEDSINEIFERDGENNNNDNEEGAAGDSDEVERKAAASKLLNDIKNGTGSAGFDQFEESAAAQEDEEAI